MDGAVGISFPRIRADQHESCFRILSRHRIESFDDLESPLPLEVRPNEQERE